MSEQLLSTREITKADVELITQYWLTANHAFLQSMGVDLTKMPSKDQWIKMLSGQLDLSYKEKKSYCIIWLAGNKPVGHCNVNKIVFGEEAYMHLHVWIARLRKKGSGTILVKKTLPFFFDNLKLKKVYCEPYALNPAPNRTLEKIGFRFIREYTTTPGFLNFEQPVKRWEMTYENFRKLT